MRQQNEPINIQALQQLLGGSLIWVSAAFLLVMGLAFSMVRIGTVTGEEAGILLHRLTGEIEVISDPGKIIYNGLMGDFLWLIFMTNQLICRAWPAGFRRVSLISRQICAVSRL